MNTNSNLTIEYLKVLRPDHWLKNIFIFFGHGVAIALLGTPINGTTILTILFSLIPACLIASAHYIINEILDAPFDRLHPTKKHRSVAAGTVKTSVLWLLMLVICVIAFTLSLLFFNISYTLSLLLLLISGFVYNVPPVRLKDKPFLDVICESFNNPIRLWLGWYALAPATSFPPLSIILSWWFFGALLMAGKRYSEYRFIGDPVRSGEYRRSFKTYTEKSLIISMITYANFFCFCMGVAMAVYRPNLILIFPIVVIAIIAYFHHAMSTEGAKLEPEQLMRNPILIVCTLLTVGLAVFLTWSNTDFTEIFHFLRLIPGKP